jgi:hypothetical protein
MLELTRRIQRIDIDLRGAGANDAEEGDRESQQIGHHHRNTVALFHAEPLLQIGREIPRLPVHIGIAQGLAEGAEGGPVRIRRHRPLKQLHHRLMCVRVDIGRDAVLRVGRQPVPILHVNPLPVCFAGRCRVENHGKTYHHQSVADTSPQG